MKCVIIEDEKVASERLVGMIKEYDPETEILSTLQSVKKSVDWFESNVSPDLVFMDIQLSDGLSFEIFEQTNVNFPVIFTTAFDEYAIKAFKHNGIDYLLKPIDKEELKNAIDKFRKQYKPDIVPQHIFDSILNNFTHNFKNKFVIKVGEHLRIIQISEVQCFYSLEKAVFLQNFDGRDYAVNYSLDQLEELLDPSVFFRINRKYLVAFNAIKDIVAYSNSRLLLKLTNCFNDDLIVSRDRVPKFRQWLEE